jgi:hypothetical protein
MGHTSGDIPSRTINRWGIPYAEYLEYLHSAPSLTWSHGSKTLRGGVDMRTLQYSTQSSGNVLTLNSAVTFTQEIYNTAQALKGNSIASWLLGTPSSGSVTYAAFPIFQFPYAAPWIQFDWKVLPKLTINVGYRQDFNLPPTERLRSSQSWF